MSTLGIVWMSAGNSYFTESVVSKIIARVSSLFGKVVVMAPDLPAEHTYKALGYESAKAVKKARLNANLLQNRAKRVVNSYPHVSVVEWSDTVENNEHYLSAYKYITSLFAVCDEFRQDALSTTRQVLESKGGVVSETSLQEGVQYLLKELAFVLAANKIFGASKAVYCYHKEWPVYEKLIGGDYHRSLYDSLGFCKLEQYS